MLDASSSRRVVLDKSFGQREKIKKTLAWGKNKLNKRSQLQPLEHKIWGLGTLIIEEREEPTAYRLKLRRERLRF